MSPSSLTEQSQIERETLRNIKNAVMAVIAWEFPDAGSTDKLVRLRFVASALERHLSRLLALEGRDGYLEEVVDTSPHLAEAVGALRLEQEQLQDLLRRIVDRLEAAAPTNQARLAVVADELFAVVHSLEQHEHKEIDLMQEAFLRDEGGEG